VNPSTPSNPRSIIRAAGALLWRRTSSGYEIAVIHRNRYDDWTLPKGKLKKDESWQAAALREVKEETGYDATVLGFAGAVTYTANDKPKVVRFWHMMAESEPSSELDDEVDEVIWLTVDAARNRLQYPLEQALLEVWQGPGDLAP
jgi:8-oxo-dGTP pyrophosphatase MutT (NUDIX family)